MSLPAMSMAFHDKLTEQLQGEWADMMLAALYNDGGIHLPLLERQRLKEKLMAILQITVKT